MRTYYKIRYAHGSGLRAFAHEPLYLILLRYILGCMLLALLWVILFGNRDTAWGTTNLNDAIQIIGAIMAIAALGLLWWSHHCLKEAFSTTIETSQIDKLVMTGPYRYIRHPMYLSYFILFPGLGLLIENWLFALLGILIIVTFTVIRIKFEERALNEKFPQEYSDYTMRVNGFIFFNKMKNK